MLLAIGHHDASAIRQPLLGLTVKKGLQLDFHCLFQQVMGSSTEERSKRVVSLGRCSCVEYMVIIDHGVSLITGWLEFHASRIRCLFQTHLNSTCEYIATPMRRIYRATLRYRRS